MIKSARYLGQLKRINSVQKMASPGERVISSLFPNRTYINNWSGNLYEQVNHFKQWTYVAVHTICSRLAGLTPNFVYSYDESIPGVTRKAYQHGYSNLQKSLSAIKPHEDLEPLENEHPLRRLFENPNPVDTAFDFLYETQMFQELTGVSYTWAIPNAQGVPCELWCIPSHWVWPRAGGNREVSPAHPHAGELIEYYEVRPWGGTTGANFIRFPPNEIIMERWKSPIDKINGYAKLTAGAQWVDTEESITRSRWSQFINQAMPGLHLELGSGYEDPDDNEIARIEAKFMARFQGEANFGRPIITPPGAKVTPLGFSPTEMSYKDSENEIRDMILSLFQVPKAAVGISEGMTFGSVMATLASMCSQCINPRLTMRGQTLTKHLASRWSKPGRRVKLFWEDCVPSDPAQVNSDIMTDIAAYAITPSEVRALRGRASYKHGGDDPIVQGPGGPMPFPINTGEDIEDLAELIKPFAQPEQVEEQAAEGGPLELPQPTTEGVGNESPLAEAPEIDEVESIAPEEPNGKPSKSLVTKTNPVMAAAIQRHLRELAMLDQQFEREDSELARKHVAELNALDDKHGRIEDDIDDPREKTEVMRKHVQERKAVDLRQQKEAKALEDKYADKEEALRERHERELDGLDRSLKTNSKPSKSVKKVAKGFTPVASGLAVMAYDTGRVLMLQRHIDDNSGGTWEFPGGKIEGDTDPLESAKREWYEETGIELPTGKLVDNWQGTNGKYQGFVYLVSKEDDVDIINRSLDTNPDGDAFEVVAWVSPKDFDNHNLRPELLADLTHLQRATTLGKSLRYMCKHVHTKRGVVVKSIVKTDGSCKPGERADLTGCIPLSGEGGTKTEAKPEAKPDASKAKTAIVNSFKTAAEKFTDVKETMLALGEIGGSALPESAQTALVKTYGAVRYIEHKLMTGYNKSREMAENVALERGLGEEYAAKVGKVVGVADLVVGWTMQAPAILALTGGNVAAAKVGTWIPACSLAYVAYSAVRNPLAVLRAAKKTLAGKKEEPKKRMKRKAKVVKK